MNAAKSLSTIFKINASEFGASTTSNILQVVIYRLLEDIANDYIEASKSDVA